MRQYIDSQLIHARSVDEFDAAWALFKTRYANLQDKIDYLQKEWIECRHRWAKPWRLQTMTFGICSNSPAESTNSVIGKWLGPTLKLNVSPNLLQFESLMPCRLLCKSLSRWSYAVNKKRLCSAPVLLSRQPMSFHLRPAQLHLWRSASANLAPGQPACFRRSSMLPRGTTSAQPKSMTMARAWSL